MAAAAEAADTMIMTALAMAIRDLTNLLTPRPRRQQATVQTRTRSVSEAGPFIQTIY